MVGAFSVLAGVGIVCASGIVVSSAFKFFHTFEFDLTAKIKESKKAEAKKEIGGENHELRMANLSRKAIDKQ
ncbi:hypothetical protein M3649_04360 [Ureibacillus chungkukjangi]|uniref:DUF7394 family protein n=1 Tax=Ureibacillus chungkukjangi TaxID=1202712 RepID=UPI002042213D|nr:hypothetical protein [Ureibacillus chungkukjangi]MCM3387367.1 hypothetical protein [Ureibacillus chungkukjangi]